MSTPRLVVAALFLAVVSVQAQVTNGGFETGNLSGWTSTGTASAGGSFSGQAPNQGSFQAIITSPAGGTVFRSSLESFLGLTNGALASREGPVTNGGGSAIRQTITVAAGAMLRFAWNYVAGGSPGVAVANDSVFFTLHLAAVSGTAADVFTLDQLSNHPGGTASGYTIFTTGPLAAGTYVLGFSTFDAITFGTDTVSPNLLIDGVTVLAPPPARVPETGSTLLFLACAAMVLSLGLRRARRV